MWYALAVPERRNSTKPEQNQKSTSNTIAYSESYNNSSIQNKNGSINIRTKNTNDTNKGNVSVIGANIEGKDINIDVANNLIVESLQNKEYSNSSRDDIIARGYQPCQRCSP